MSGTNISSHYAEALRLARARNVDAERVLRLLRRAEKSGDARATYAIGTWLLHGKPGVLQKDARRAVKMLTRASAEGHSDAVFDLAVCYEKGVGVSTNGRKAVLLYVKAALLGDKQAIYEVGRCYWHGLGLKSDRALARIWLDQAKRSGVRG